MNPEQRIDRLQAAIEELRVEYERFFNGGRDVPPEEIRDRIQSELRALRNAKLKAAADNYRLAQLEARYNSFSEMYGRRLRQVEEGRGPAAAAADRPDRDPERGVVVGERLTTESVEALYQGLARASGRGPKFDLESFRGYLEKQAGAIRSKTGCSQVRFRLVPDGDGVKLKAKPIAGD